MAQLPGWAQDDHAAALEAFIAACPANRDPAMDRACAAARRLGPLDEAAARGFLEARFRTTLVGDVGLLTGYYSPDYEARAARDLEFSAPLLPRPTDLLDVDAGLLDPARAGRRVAARRNASGELRPYDDRAAIEGRDPPEVLAWMRPEDLFFLQIQGSGALTFPDGRRLKAVFAGSNGLAFVAIGGIMAAQGLIPLGDASAQSVRAWLASHRGPQADAVMRLDPRYVFFRLISDDGSEPVGSAGVPLIAGRSIAIDPSAHPYGGLYWLDADAPGLPGARTRYRRLVVALDSGGAIQGATRADLYLGRGTAAGDEAGRVRHALRLYRLVPVDGAAP
ncbi:MAG: MltA domain-containing protein [Caulobacterales bacterium]